MNRYITLDGNKYVVSAGSYIRDWNRSFSTSLAANIIRLNFVDRGPGLRVYKMTLILTDWSSDSDPYKDGITKSAITQKSDLEATYAKISTSIQFIDPYGNVPGAGGVYFTNLRETIPSHSTVQKPYIEMQIELNESTQVVA